MSFLKAEWRKLAIVNYKIDPKVLESFIPEGTELDIWNGICYVSLVGFMFKNTKLLGLKIPFHINFEEVNLRFYVKRRDKDTWKRGVVFIKEIVPKPALTYVANTIYKEHYETLPMAHLWTTNKNNTQVQYKWKINNVWQSFQIEAYLNPVEIPENSEVEFITEHYWGYSKINNNQTNEYEVTDPKWLHYPVLSYNIDVDFELTYGKNFRFLNTITPKSVMLAEGSEITVESKKTLYL